MLRTHFETFQNIYMPLRNVLKDGCFLVAFDHSETFLSLSLGFNFNKPSNNSKQSGVARVTTSDSSLNSCYLPEIADSPKIQDLLDAVLVKMIVAKYLTQRASQILVVIHVCQKLFVVEIFRHFP